MNARRAARFGYTLLETLIVMEVLVIVLGLGAAVLTGALRVWQASAAAQTHCNERVALAEVFRADVRQATATPARLDSWSAGPTCLILRQGEDCHVVYRWRDSRLERLAGEQSQFLPLGVEGTAVEFLQPGPGGLLTLRLTPPPPRTVQEISAALGGDVQ